ncbi:hypothetical protein FHT00_001235 [Sphingomonas insulae]|uniref:Uncharacterized protein n=1 Tax=Sphingomonas insulae TaxID=424800 RepID=A0ABN1HQU7_9SPHN|nr:hypothetical protein [Sphingomonas insulae]NIJ29302.1 hypothetical protein [Sphingomonas insulae]
MTDNPRTETARENDDTDLIEGMIPADEAVAGSGGGTLAQDVGSNADLTRAIDDPEARDRAAKQDDVDQGQARPADRGPGR